MLTPTYFCKSLLYQNISMAWPMALNALLLHSMTLVDLLLIAPLGEGSVAAFGIASAIVVFVLGIQLAMSSGSQLLLSRAVGAADRSRVTTELYSGWVINLCFTVTAISILLLCLPWLLDTVSEEPSFTSKVEGYVYVSLPMLLFSSAAQVIIVYCNASGKTKVPLYGYILELPINIVVSYAFIYGAVGMPELGVKGAALGTCVAVLTRFSFLCYYLRLEWHHKKLERLALPSRGVISHHFHEVFPITCNFLVMLSAIFLLQMLFSQLPVAAYAAITLVMPWIKLGTMLANTWVQAGVIILSQTLGKEEFKKVPAIIYQSLYTTRFLSVLVVFIFFILSHMLPLIYSGLSDETLAALSIIAPIYIILPLFRIHNMCCGNMIRAMGDAYLIVRINIVSQLLVSVPLCAVLIYFNFSLLFVFGVLLFEEIIKCRAFYTAMQQRMKAMAA